MTNKPAANLRKWQKELHNDQQIRDQQANYDHNKRLYEKRKEMKAIEKQYKELLAKQEQERKERIRAKHEYERQKEQENQDKNGVVISDKKIRKMTKKQLKQNRIFKGR